MITTQIYFLGLLVVVLTMFVLILQPEPTMLSLCSCQDLVYFTVLKGSVEMLQDLQDAEGLCLFRWDPYKFGCFFGNLGNVGIHVSCFWGVVLWLKC